MYVFGCSNSRRFILHLRLSIVMSHSFLTDFKHISACQSLSLHIASFLPFHLLYLSNNALGTPCVVLSNGMQDVKDNGDHPDHAGLGQHHWLFANSSNLDILPLWETPLPMPRRGETSQHLYLRCSSKWNAAPALAPLSDNVSPQFYPELVSI